MLKIEKGDYVLSRDGVVCIAFADENDAGEVDLARPGADGGFMCGCGSTMIPAARSDACASAWRASWGLSIRAVWRDNRWRKRDGSPYYPDPLQEGDRVVVCGSICYFDKHGTIHKSPIEPTARCPGQEGYWIRLDNVGFVAIPQKNLRRERPDERPESKREKAIRLLMGDMDILRAGAEVLLDVVIEAVREKGEKR